MSFDEEEYDDGEGEAARRRLAGEGGEGTDECDLDAPKRILTQSKQIPGYIKHRNTYSDHEIEKRFLLEKEGEDEEDDDLSMDVEDIVNIPGKATNMSFKRAKKKCNTKYGSVELTGQRK